MKKNILALVMILSTFALQAKTLIVYYSFTNNVRTVVQDLATQIQADVLRIEPREKGLDYAANNYAIGSALIAAIRANPDEASSYPEIDPVTVNLSDYDVVIVAAPLWWNNMAAPLQTFLFHYGEQMSGKNIGLIVSSASSGISGVESDAKRLISNGRFLEPTLWIRSSQTSSCHTMIANWLDNINYNDLSTSIHPASLSTNVEIQSVPGEIKIVGTFTTASIYNFSGNKILETSDALIHTSNLNSGNYVIYVNSPNETVTKKIYIQ